MKKRRDKITFEREDDALAGALAKLGQGYSVIAEDCTDEQGKPLSTGKISYRLRKLQKLEGLSGGYIRSWQRGESELARQVRQDLVAIVKRDIQRTIPIQIAHPAPKFISLPDAKAPTVDEAVRLLRRKKVAS